MYTPVNKFVDSNHKLAGMVFITQPNESYNLEIFLIKPFGNPYSGSIENNNGK